MSFGLVPATPFVAFVTKVSAATLNAWRAMLPDALDAVSGGVYNILAGHTIDFPAGGGDWVIDAPLSFSDGTIPLGGQLVANGNVTVNGTLTTNGVASLQGIRNYLAADTYVNNGKTLKVGDATYGIGHLVVDGAGGGDMTLQAGADFIVTGAGTSVQFQNTAVLSMASGCTANLNGTNNLGGPNNISGLTLLTGTQPAATADPGGNNALHGKSVAKAWADISCDGAGGATVDADGYNVDSAAINGSGDLVVTFKRAMANARYDAGITAVHAGSCIVAQPIARTTTSVTFGLIGLLTQPTPGPPSAANIEFQNLNTSGGAVVFTIRVFAKQ